MKYFKWMNGRNLLLIIQTFSVELLVLISLCVLNFLVNPKSFQTVTIHIFTYICYEILTAPVVNTVRFKIMNGEKLWPTSTWLKEGKVRF